MDSIILKPDGSPFQRARQKRHVSDLRASFDAAVTTTDNQRHWAAADGLAPNDSVGPDIRRILRNRSRYEVRNNSYLRGMISTKANYVVGRGPRLQMTYGSASFRSEVEEAWRHWSRGIRLAAKLRTLYTAKLIDGEGFAIFTNDASQSPVQLGLRLFEADMVTDPWWSQDSRNERFPERRIDGLRLDRVGNPSRYHVLYEHPGSTFASNNGRWVDAGQILHLFREDRPGQRRGIPYITPALPLFAILRRYTLATLHSAEWTAELNAVMKSNVSMTGDDIDELEENFLEVPWARNMVLTLPVGWDIQQLKAADSTTTYSEFYKAVLNESCRCLEMPLNIAAANSTDVNYSGGRMDRLLFFKSVEIEIDGLEAEVVDPVFTNWLQEYLSVTTNIAPSDIDVTEYTHKWGWDGTEDDDPEKIAKSDETYWNLGLLTDEQWLIRHNIDPEEHYEQLERQAERRRSVGLPLPGVAMQQINTGNGEESDDQVEEEEVESFDSEQ